MEPSPLFSIFCAFYQGGLQLLPFLVPAGVRVKEAQKACASDHRDVLEKEAMVPCWSAGYLEKQRRGGLGGWVGCAEV